MLTCCGRAFLVADNPKMWTACGHHYHVPCLYEWLERKDTCPICECKISDGFEA